MTTKIITNANEQQTAINAAINAAQARGEDLIGITINEPEEDGTREILLTFEAVKATNQ